MSAVAVTVRWTAHARARWIERAGPDTPAPPAVEILRRYYGQCVTCRRAPRGRRVIRRFTGFWVPGTDLVLLTRHAPRDPSAIRVITVWPRAWFDAAVDAFWSGRAGA